MFGRKHRARLMRENAALRDALAWYADKATWRRKATNAPGQPRQWVKSPAGFDRGARAKFVLTQVDSDTARDLLAAGAIERLLDRFIGNAAGEPIEPPTVPKPLANSEPTTTAE